MQRASLVLLAVIAVASPLRLQAQSLNRALVVAKPAPTGMLLPSVVDPLLRARMKLLGLFERGADSVRSPAVVADTIARLDCPMPVVAPDSVHTDAKMVYRRDASGQAPMPVHRPACVNSLKR